MDGQRELREATRQDEPLDFRPDLAEEAQDHLPVPLGTVPQHHP